jgi:general stress protein CsbA
MTTVKEQMSKVTANVPGAIVGGVAVFYASKRFGKVANKWALAGLTVVGVLAGAMVQAKMKARKGAPTATTIKK